MSDMKNIIVLKDLPSNLIEEAFVVLKENKKIHRYQTVENKTKKVNETKNNKDYIIKEAEMLLKSYTEDLEKKGPSMKKLEKRYKNSLRINLLLLFTTILGVAFSFV